MTDTRENQDETFQNETDQNLEQFVQAITGEIDSVLAIKTDEKENLPKKEPPRDNWRRNESDQRKYESERKNDISSPKPYYRNDRKPRTNSRTNSRGNRRIDMGERKREAVRSIIS